MDDDHTRFTAHFLDAERSIRAFLLAATRDVHVVDDLTQNLAVDLWKKWHEYDPSRPFRAWAIGAAQIAVLRWRRSLARDRMILDEEVVQQLADATVRRSVLADERRNILPGCLAQLAPVPRRVLSLKYAGGMPVKQIALEIGRSVSAIEMLLTRTRRALHDCIQSRLLEVER